MKNKFVLDQLSAAHELAAVTLKEADRAFYRQRRTIEDQIGLTHGVPGLRVKNLSADWPLARHHQPLRR